MWWTKLTPAAGTLTRARSLISEAETEIKTPRLWAVCSIAKNQYITFKIRWAKLTPAITCAFAVASLAWKDEWMQLRWTEIFSHQWRKKKISYKTGSTSQYSLTILSQISRIRPDMTAFTIKGMARLVETSDQHPVSIYKLIIRNGTLSR